MQIDAAELRSMLRGDAVGLVVGLIVLLMGLLTLISVGFLRRRVSLLLWLATFALLYGSRLLIRTGTFQLIVDVPATIWGYLDAGITYIVPIPIVLFVRALMPGWRRFWTVGAVGLTGFAVYAIASDAWLNQPFSAATANNVIAIGFFAGVVAWTLRPGLPSSRELRTVRAGALAVGLTAVADNLRGMKALSFPGPPVEPIGFTVFIVCLGIVAVRRMLADTQRLIAIDRELSIARQIQSSILPQTMPDTSGLRIAARYRPMTAVAGDFYDFLKMDDQRLGVLVADVSGHGVPAALIASMVKVALAAQRERADSPAAVLAGLNRALCGQMAGQYVTAAYLFVDIRSGLIRYAAAGHPPMLRATRQNGAVEEITKNGLLLGFTVNTKYDEVERPLCIGDRFLLYTDGLVEATNADDDLFGLDRLKVHFAAAAGLPPYAVSDALLSVVDTWSGRPQGDDVTLVLVDRVAANEGE
jgi:phosphoserine phosphatase RsbU/P